MRLFRPLSVVLLMAGCASGSGQAENDQTKHQTIDKEWPVSAHYDGKRFYNTSGAAKSVLIFGRTSQIVFNRQCLWRLNPAGACALLRRTKRS